MAYGTCKNRISETQQHGTPGSVRFALPDPTCCRYMLTRSFLIMRHGQLSDAETQSGKKVLFCQ